MWILKRIKVILTAVVICCLSVFLIYYLYPTAEAPEQYTATTPVFEELVVNDGAPLPTVNSDTIYDTKITKTDIPTIKPTEQCITPIVTLAQDKELQTVVNNNNKSSINKAYYTPFAIECNEHLYKLCDEYFRVPYNEDYLPILIPMAIANNETPGRANFSITFTSLFPSAIVDIQTTDDIDNFSIKDVVRDKKLFSALSREYSTRDRGALQMSPTYGTAKTIYYDLMGPSETSVLDTIKEYENWYGYETKESGSNFTLSQWIGRASTERGDRFNIKDVILRMANAANSAASAWSRHYTAESEYMQVVMVAMYHINSGVWSMSSTSTRIGKWRSMDVAYEYATSIASDKFVGIVFRKVFQDIEVSHRNKQACIPNLSTNGRKQLFAEAVNAGILEDVSYYVTDDFVVPYYAIGALYNYIMLKLLYMGY